jgi:hypothetical protein
MTTERKSSDEYNELGRFVGRWNTEGKILATDSTPEVKIVGTDNYEWLPGGYFLLHKADVLIGDDKSETFEVIGFDQSSGKYTMQHYDNKGDSGLMTATYEKGVWIFLGETLRFTGGFKKEDKEFSGIWEQLTDGKNWTHFMDIKLTKKD